LASEACHFPDAGGFLISGDFGFVIIHLNQCINRINIYITYCILHVYVVNLPVIKADLDSTGILNHLPGYLRYLIKTCTQIYVSQSLKVDKLQE
jgi:hypothetical protein